MFAHGTYWTGTYGNSSDKHIFRGLHPTQMQEVTASNLPGIYEMAAAGDRMVAFSSYGTRGFFYSDDGIDWTRASMPSDDTNRGESLVHLGGRFMALYGGRILTSEDGSSWTSWDTGNHYSSRNQPEFLAHGIGRHLVLSKEGHLWVSNNGSSWSHSVLGHLLKGFADEFSGIAADENGVVVFTENTGYYSEDLTAWFEFNLPVTEALMPVVFNGALIATTYHEGLPILLRGGRSDTLAPTVGFRNKVDGGRYFVNGHYTIEGDVYDPEGGTVETHFYVDGELEGISTDELPRFSWNPDTSGTVELKLVARNAAGISGEARIALAVVGSSPVGPANLLNAHRVTAADDRLLLLGRKGTLATSRNGIDWQRLALPRDADLDSVVYGNGAYVGGGEGEGVFVSLDGINWTTIPGLEGRAGFDNGWFYVVGSNYLHISPDGLTWDAVEPPYLHPRHSVVFFEGEKIMVTGPGTVSVSRNSGKVWSETPIPGSHAMRSGDAILTMSDGMIHRTEDWQSWQSLPTPSAGQNGLFAAGGVLFVGTAAGSSRYGWELEHFSSDGMNWQPISGAPKVNAIAYGNGTWIGFGYMAAFRSTDGANWQYALGDDGTGNRETLADSPFLSDNWTVAHSDATGFVAVDAKGLRATSPDGEEWTILRGLSDGRYGPTPFASLGDTFVSNGSCNNMRRCRTAWSTDLVNWRESGWVTLGRLTSMKTVGDRILATTDLGEFGISDNGRTWQVSTPADSATLYDASEGGGTYAVLGDRVVHLSSDGANWQSHAMPLRYKKIRHLNGEFFAYDSNGRRPLLSRSTDGVNWQAVESVDTGTSLGNVDSISYGNDTFILNNEVEAVVSTDLTGWSDAGIPTKERFKGSTFHPELGFALLTGTDGAFLSDDGLSWRREPLLTEAPERIWADGDQIFIGSVIGIEALTNNDLEVVSLQPSRREIGVGESLEIVVVVENHAAKPLDLSVVTVDLRASRDSIIGNGDDLILAEALRTDAVLNAAERRALTFKIEIPSDVAGGEFLAAARIVTPDTWIEANLANNTAYTEPGVLFIPEWSLDLLASGNGQVNRDLSALRYPHGARVSLTATAGKGAAFTGWGWRRRRR